LARAGHEAASLRLQAGKRFLNGLKPSADFLGLLHS
jgi:hypothetical protein